MGKLVGINGYDPALPSAYQGRAMGGGCGCGGGIGKVYDFKVGPNAAPVDVPLEAMAQDLMASTRLERIAITAGLAVVLIGGMYFIGKR